MSRWVKEEVKTHSEYVRQWAKTPAGLAYKEKHKKYMKEWRQKNPDKFHSTQKRNYRQLKLDVLSHYSTNLSCKCCGEGGIDFLTLDHINGNGAAHRRTLANKNGTPISGNGFYYWIKKNNFPAGFQVLCANCNFAKRQNNSCPHQHTETGDFQI